MFAKIGAYGIGIKGACYYVINVKPYLINQEFINMLSHTNDETTLLNARTDTQVAMPSSSIVKGAGEELSTATVTHLFRSAPERFLPVVPDNERNAFQNIISLSSDLLINLGARDMATGNLSIPEGLAVCGTATISKAIVLKTEKEEEKKPEPFTIQDGKAIAKASTQAGLIRMFQAQAGKIGESVATESGVTASVGMATAAAPIVAGLYITPLRLPGVPQVPESEKTVAQQVGHMVVNAGIIASIGFFPISIPTALAGCFIGIVANTIIGKKREHTIDCSPSM